jgi:hypothetical protein
MLSKNLGCTHARGDPLPSLTVRKQCGILSTGMDFNPLHGVHPQVVLSPGFWRSRWAPAWKSRCWASKPTETHLAPPVHGGAGIATI